MSDGPSNQGLSSRWYNPSEYVGVEPAKLREIRASEVAIRFLFGSATSLLAGGLGLLLSPSAGGLFLAFPAILAASLTLVERKEGRDAALDDARGAILGASGLVLFSVVAWLLLGGLQVLALLAAMAAWCAVALGLYTLVTWLRRSRGP